MSLRLQKPVDQFVTLGGQLALLAAAIALESVRGWFVVLSCMAAVALYGWHRAVQRRRAIHDTPTSKIATAAQGYVELQGRGALFGDNPLRSPLTGLPCLWYRFTIETKNHENEWHISDRGESNTSIVLDDDSGRAIADPERAEILTTKRDRWVKGDYRYTEWNLIAGDPIYILGDLRTIGGYNLQLDFNGDIGNLLAEWKRDSQALLARFDLDGNGEVDTAEWRLARSAARREVEKSHREARNQADVHLVRAPVDGRPYLISSLDPDKLARRFGWWSLFHLAIFFGALAAIPWVLKSQHFG